MQPLPCGHPVSGLQRHSWRPGVYTCPGCVQLAKAQVADERHEVEVEVLAKARERLKREGPRWSLCAYQPAQHLLVEAVSAKDRLVSFKAACGRVYTLRSAVQNSKRCRRCEQAGEQADMFEG